MGRILFIHHIQDLKPEFKRNIDICLAAVNQNGYALQYVHEQTPGICLAAVNENGCALKYVHEQTHEICLAAVNENVRALEYVREQKLMNTGVEEETYFFIISL